MGGWATDCEAMETVDSSLCRDREKELCGAEAVNMIANMMADFPKHVAYLATHNRTINTEGKPGHGN